MKLKIPGLTFLIVPILIWLTIEYNANIVTFFSSLTVSDIIHVMLVFSICNVLFCLEQEAEYWDKYLIPWVIIKYIYKILKYINTKLTVEL